MMSLSASLRDFQNLSPQQWLERASQTLPQIVSVVLVVAIAWQLVQLTWLLLDRPSSEEPVAIAAATPGVNQPRRGIDVQAIVNAHLFGLPQAETKASEDAPQTQMNLVLSAVFAADDPAKGLAIIGESAQTAKVYAVGATVRSGTRLHEVYSDRVILDRGGQLEALLLPKQNTAGLAINRAPTPAAATQFADNLRRIAENNPTAFAEIIRPQPVFASGVQRGYRVYPGRNRQQFAKLGLQPGDLVLSINGTPLDDPQRGMEIFNTLGSSDRVSVTIERNGQTQEMTLNTAQVTLPESNPGASPERPKAQRLGAPPAFAPSPPER
jgi:general secretion pathway protein C